MRLPRLLIAVLAALALAAPAAADATTVTPRVIGGTPVTDPAAWPAFTRLSIYTADSVRTCGGTLITATVVLTAAHCVSGAIAPSSWAIVGAIDYSSGQWIAWRSYRAHPLYDPATERYDVALIRLAAAASADPLPIIAPDQDASLATPLTLGLAGFGLVAQSPDQMPTQLQTTTVPLVGDAACLSAYPGPLPSALYDAATMLCAGDSGHDACSGDSGGPLTADFGGTATLVGDVSWGGPVCADGAHPGVYGRVSAFRPWLATALANPTVTSVTSAGDDVTVRWSHSDPSPAHAAISSWSVAIGATTLPADAGAAPVTASVPAGGIVSVRVVASSGAVSTTGSWAGTPTATRVPRSAAAAIAGTARVGARLRATSSSDDPWATATYQWRANGVRIAGATRAAYAPTRSVRGQRITVTATLRHGTYAATPVTSVATARVTAAPLPAVRVVRTRGTAHVGGLLYVVAPSGRAYPAARVRYAWLRDGRPIARATRAAYRPRTADAGHRVSCRITYRNALGSAIVRSRARTVGAAG